MLILLLSDLISAKAELVIQRSRLPNPSESRPYRCRIRAAKKLVRRDAASYNNSHNLFTPSKDKVAVAEAEVAEFAS